MCIRAGWWQEERFASATAPTKNASDKQIRRLFEVLYRRCAYQGLTLYLSVFIYIYLSISICIRAGWWREEKLASAASPTNIRQHNKLGAS